MHKTSGSGFRGRVLIVSSRLDAWLLFIGRTLIRAAYDVTIVANTDVSSEDHDHRDVLKYFLTNPFCRLVDIKEASRFSETRYDFAIVGVLGLSSTEEKQKLLAITGSTPLRAVLLEISAKRRFCKRRGATA